MSPTQSRPGVTSNIRDAFSAMKRRKNAKGLFFVFVFVLFCFVLFCFVLFCFVLFCFVLFCFVLFCFVLFCGEGDIEY